MKKYSHYIQSILSRIHPALFKTISASGTVGLSTGAAQTLTSTGKFYIIILMLIGRIGVAAFAYILTGFKTVPDIEFAEKIL
jgi:trk system potassium uptake protein